MSMNMFEKFVTIGLVGSSVLFVGMSFFKDTKATKHDAFKVRQQLLKRDDIKMLYSTLSFFYLQGFKSQSAESFFNLHRILQIEKPNIVVLPISEQDYNNKYLKAMKHPKYKQAMEKLIFHLKNKDEEGLKSIDQFDLKNLEKLYLIHECIKQKQCKVVCGRRTNEEYSRLAQAYKEINTKEQYNLSVHNVKIEDFTEAVLHEMTPKVKFSILPESPYKTIIGIIQPELLNETGEKWKKKFKQSYSHEVIEDEEVLKREQIMREAQGKSIY